MSTLSEVPSTNIRPPSRVRRDRSRTSSTLKWNNVSTLPDKAAIQTPSLKIEDYDPGYALRKIALLYEKNQNEEVASLIKKLSLQTLNKIFPDFPVEMFIEGIPHTLCIVNALYSRIFTEHPRHFPVSKLPLTSLVIQIVKLYARSLSKDLPKLKSWGAQEAQCRNLLKVAGYVDGISILKMLRHRRRCIDRALDGLGEHGMVEVETSPIGVEEVQSELMPLPSALRVELERMSSNCKFSTQKLNRAARALSRHDSDSTPRSPTRRSNAFSFESNKGDKSPGSLEPPTECNHQRMLHYTSSNIQDRLYKNKAILNVVEPTMNYAQLPRLVSVLQERIECDKDLLLTFSQLRKEIVNVAPDAKLAPALTHYSQAFNAVINVLKEFVPDDPGTPETSSTNGFRSDSETNMSPFRSKASSRASPLHNGGLNGSFNGSDCELNTSSNSGLSNGSNSKSHGTENAEVAALQKKCDNLHVELHRAKKSIERLRHREKDLTGRLSMQAQRSFDGGSGSFEDLASEVRPSELARSYRNLYSDGRLQALDALDATWRTEDDVKAKLLFSVMVLSFRSCSDTLHRIRHSLHDIMCASRAGGDPRQESAVKEVESVFNAYLRKTTKSYDISPNFEDVFNQICSALYDRPSLTQSRALHGYVRECVKLSWSLAVITPPLFLEYDAVTFDPSKHDRFHTSDKASNQIVSYLWPSLLEKQSGKCVAKGIVITGV